MSESVILCEGYHDRAFWAGWLKHLGCVDPGLSSDGTGRKPVYDPSGRLVSRGQFGFYSKGQEFIKVVPCGGDTKAVAHQARKLLNDELQRWQQKASESRLVRLVFNIDPDVIVDDTAAKTGFTRGNLRQWVGQFDSPVEETQRGDIVLFGGGTVVSLVRWEASDPEASGLPNQQTLERLVCAAIIAAYPERRLVVQKWLDSRPNGLQAGPKEYAWSHMAGWYAELGCEAFYRRVWEEDRVAEELRRRLSESGACRIAEALAE